MRLISQHLTYTYIREGGEGQIIKKGKKLENVIKTVLNESVKSLRVIPHSYGDTVTQWQIPSQGDIEHVTLMSISFCSNSISKIFFFFSS